MKKTSTNSNIMHMLHDSYQINNLILKTKQTIQVYYIIGIINSNLRYVSYFDILLLIYRSITIITIDPTI